MSKTQGTYAVAPLGGELRGIIAYTGDVKFAPMERAALLKSGFIVIKVSNLDSIRVVPVPVTFAPATLGAAAQAAFETIFEHEPSKTVGPKQMFGSKLAKALAGK